MDIGLKGLNPLAEVILTGSVQKMLGFKIQGIHRPPVKSGERDTPPFTMKGSFRKADISGDKKKGPVMGDDNFKRTRVADAAIPEMVSAADC
jgi:hypothetical protein